MDYPPPHAVAIADRDVIGAWLVCLVIAAAGLGGHLLSAAPEIAAIGRHAAADSRNTPLHAASGGQACNSVVKPANMSRQ